MKIKASRSLTSLCTATAALALAGCAVVKIGLCPGIVGVDAGSEVVLKIKPLPKEQRDTSQFQWYLGDDTNWIPVADATNDTLVFRRIKLTNAGDYRCIVYRTFPAWTNISAEVNLQVTEKPTRRILIKSVGATSAGTLQTSSLGFQQTNCDGTPFCQPQIENPSGFALFSPPSGNTAPPWWGPANVNTTSTVTDISQSICHYSNYVGQIVVTECRPSNGCYVNYCGTVGTNSTRSFPVTQGNYYQFVLIAKSPQLKKGKQLQVQISPAWWP